MDRSYKLGLFPWVSLLIGSLGFALHSSMFSNMDAAGLLPKNHIPWVLSLILLAMMLAVCFVAVRKIKPAGTYGRMFPASKIAAAGIALSGIGMGSSAFFANYVGASRILIPVLGVVSAAALCLAAFCRLQGRRPSCLLHCAATVYLICRVMAGCRVWSAEPQLYQYFFPLITSVFLLIASYYRAELDMHDADCRRYIFFSQVALFCCCVCLAGTDKLFYLSAGLWMAADFCVIPEAHRDS